MERFHALIIGGGVTGGALAHDLALRGLQVTLVERGEVTSGTTGRHHGLVHSGARYAVEDKESAVECIEENKILRRIMPGTFEENDGLFVALTGDDVAYSDRFLEACAQCGMGVIAFCPLAQGALTDKYLQQAGLAHRGYTLHCLRHNAEFRSMPSVF